MFVCYMHTLICTRNRYIICAYNKQKPEKGVLCYSSSYSFEVGSLPEPVVFMARLGAGKPH